MARELFLMEFLKQEAFIFAQSRICALHGRVWVLSDMAKEGVERIGDLDGKSSACIFEG
jgi:hypothetical protein